MWIDERVASQVNETYCSPLFMNQVDLCMYQYVRRHSQTMYFSTGYGKEKISIFFRILDVQGKKSTGD